MRTYRRTGRRLLAEFLMIPVAFYCLRSRRKFFWAGTTITHPRGGGRRGWFVRKASSGEKGRETKGVVLCDPGQTSRGLPMYLLYIARSTTSGDSHPSHTIFTLKKLHPLLKLLHKERAQLGLRPANHPNSLLLYRFFWRVSLC